MSSSIPGYVVDQLMCLAMLVSSINHADHIRLFMLELSFRIQYFYITIVDFVTGIPLHMDIFADTKKESSKPCFRTFRLLYKKDPTLIVSDGSKALAAARQAVFPKVHCQLCKFHKLRNLFAMISKSYLPNEPNTS